ncbi:MAG: phospholipid carrier-dependent glycosyltransferase, partial [Actinomycetota bacterium]
MGAPGDPEGVQSADQLEIAGEPPAEEPPAPAPPAPADDVASRYATDPPWSLLDWLLLAVITIGGGVIRFVRLSHPKGYVFDEVYYAKDACLYLGHAMQFCKSPYGTEQSYVHPELGKWIIATGEAVFGYNSFGWRIMACLFGTAMVVVLFLIGRKLFGRWGGALAGLFTATDFLLIVESRTAMLDIFMAFFVTLGFLFVVCDHQ